MVRLVPRRHLGHQGDLPGAAVEGGADVTGVRDKQTTVAVQSYVGADADGIWGRQTTTYLQRFLNSR